MNMEATTFAITIGIIGAACAGVALGGMFVRWLNEREIRALCNANRALKEKIDKAKERFALYSNNFIAFRVEAGEALKKKDAEIEKLLSENATLRSALKCAELRIDIRQKCEK